VKELVVFSHRATCIIYYTFNVSRLRSNTNTLPRYSGSNILYRLRSHVYFLRRRLSTISCSGWTFPACYFSMSPWK